MIEAEACLDGLEKDKVSLAELLTLYRRGVELIQSCQEDLRAYEFKIQALDHRTGKLVDVNPESVIKKHKNVT